MVSLSDGKKGQVSDEEKVIRLVAAITKKKKGNLYLRLEVSSPSYLLHFASAGIRRGNLEPG